MAEAPPLGGILGTCITRGHPREGHVYRVGGCAQFVAEPGYVRELRDKLAEAYAHDTGITAGSNRVAQLNREKQREIEAEVSYLRHLLGCALGSVERTEREMELPAKDEPCACLGHSMRAVLQPENFERYSTSEGPASLRNRRKDD